MRDVKLATHDGHLGRVRWYVLYKSELHTAMSSQSRSPLMCASRPSTSSTSPLLAHNGTVTGHVNPQYSKILFSLQMISCSMLLPHEEIPSVANTFRFGFLPTASRLATLLTRKPNKKRRRGCVTCKTSGGQYAKCI